MFANDQNMDLKRYTQKQMVVEQMRFKNNGCLFLTMNTITLFMVFAAVTIIVVSIFSGNAFAQNESQQAIKSTGGKVHENISSGLAVPVGNITDGLRGADPDKIAESLSNFTGNVSKEFNTLFNESSK